MGKRTTPQLRDLDGSRRWWRTLQLEWRPPAAGCIAIMEHHHGKEWIKTLSPESLKSLQMQCGMLHPASAHQAV